MSTSHSAATAVGYRHSNSLPEVLAQAGCTVLLSTYQAGQLIAVGVTEQDTVGFSFRKFDKAMGVAVSTGQDAAGTVTVGARDQVWTLREQSDMAPRIPPTGRYDRCFLPRSSVYTGDFAGHEIAWGHGQSGEPDLWMVNTAFSALVGLDGANHFRVRWKPPFITDLAPQDRCHLNGMAMRDGRPAFVSMLAPSNEPDGWRGAPPDSGAIVHVPSGETVLRGLTMPHSPRWRATDSPRGELFVLNSGLGLLQRIDLDAGRVETVARFPGYARGLAIHGDLAFVGLSRIRETATFGRVPLAEHHEQLKCGLGVVDLAAATTVATLEFTSGVEEVFDVQILPRTRMAALSTSDNEEIWTIG